MSVSLLIQIPITIFCILNNEKYQQLLHIFNENTDVITAAKMSMVVILLTVKKNTDKEMTVSVPSGKPPNYCGNNNFL